jgi:uracil-DNA glycosylase family 4
MSLPREEILKELELLPVWRPRVSEIQPDNQADIAAPALAAEADAGGDACAPIAPPLVTQAPSPASPVAKKQETPVPADNPLIQGVHNRDYLPHLKAEGGIYFITFRLDDSLPADVLEQLDVLPEQERSRAIERSLDQGHGECLLANPELAGIVRAALLRGADTRYRLHAWSVMPNHVHLVIEPLAEHALNDILQDIKSFTAHEINAATGRTGTFWQRESFDRLIRDDDEFDRYCAYVRQNPVKARLATSPELYAFCDAFNPVDAGGDACATTTPPPIVQAPSPASMDVSALTKANIAEMDWEALDAAIKACEACSLAKTRTQTVTGVGDRNAEWLFVGEAPGAEEDRRGEPFVGQAGKLLDNMLAAIDLKRGENVYIANVLKCRPPENRDPHGEEVVKCDPFLKRQVELIKPRLIVAMGRFAAQSLLNTDSSIGALRGKLHDYNGVPVIVTYHPAYLLRNLPDKAKAWEDLCYARRTMQDLQTQQAAIS